MPGLRLTDRSLQTLKTGKGRVDYHDAGFPDFVVRVSETGTKTFAYRYRGSDGKYHRVTLGRYPTLSLADARARARELAVEVERGRNPALALQRLKQSPSFEMLFEEYLESCAKLRKEGWAEDQRIVSRDVLPLWRGRKACEIERGDVSEVLRRVMKRGKPSVPNQVLKILKSVFGWAQDQGTIPASPCQGMSKPCPERARSRYLSAEELRQVWWELERESESVRAPLRLLILLGQRAGEITQMKWEQIDNDIWTIPHGVRKCRQKALHDHAVPLSAPALEIIESCRGRHESLVLASLRTGRKLSVFYLSEIADNIWKRAGMEPWTTHDLRRTLTTHLGSLGVNPYYRHLILGHRDGSMAGLHYDQWSYLPEKRQTLALWGHRVLEIVGERPSELGLVAGGSAFVGLGVASERSPSVG